MINAESIASADAARYAEHYVKPLYGGYCFSQLPETVLHLLGGEANAPLPAATFGGEVGPYDHVILLFIDGFGWTHWERFGDGSPFLRRFAEHGVVSKGTSMFPSTTAAHTSLLYSGALPSQTGVHEWFYYEPAVDKIITPLPFSRAGTLERETLKRDDQLDPASIFPPQTTALWLKSKSEDRIQSFVYQSGEYAYSTYSQHMQRGAQTVGFKTIAQGLTLLADSIAAQKPGAKTYHLLYIDTIDALGHRYGPGSHVVAAEAEAVLYQLERFLHARLAREAHNVALLAFADHGQIETDPARTAYLDHELATIGGWMRTNRAGDLLKPAGSKHDVFLYIRPECLDEAEAWFTACFGERMLVRRTTALVEDGFFGALPPTQKFWERVGNLVLLPRGADGVWWLHEGKAEDKRGIHGGLTPDEVYIPLLFMNY